MIIQGALFVCFLLLGLVVAWEDWRERKIRNRWISTGLLVCLGAFAFYALNSVLGFARLRVGPLGEYYWGPAYYSAVGTHLALSLGASLLLWRWAVWPAGDAKLFLVFAFFLPLIDARLPGFPRLLFLVMLINVFVPAGLALAAQTLVLAARRAAASARGAVALEREELKARVDRLRVRLLDYWPHRLSLLCLGLNLFCLFTLLRLLQRQLIGAAAGPAGRLLVFALMAAGWGKIAALLKRPLLGALAACGLSAAALVASLGYGADLPAWGARGAAMMVNFGMFLSVARVVLGFIAERQSRAALTPQDVGPGTILDDETWEAVKARLGARLGKRYSDGLSAEEAEAVRACLADGPAPAAGAHGLYRAVPFAAWIFAGAVLTLRCRATVLHSMLPTLQSAWLAAGRAVPWWSL